eukprot:6475758-Amphidinium_carterae.1
MRERRTIRERRNVESDSAAIYVKNRMPPGLAHPPPGGQYVYELDDKYAKDNMPQKENRTLCRIFHMVAELAMWQADLAIWFA